jgi:hypothetical protein
VAAAIDTLENKVVAVIPLGQAPQGVAYVPDAVPSGEGRANLQPLESIGQAVQVVLGGANGKPATRVSLFDQGIVQILQAAATGLEAKKPYVLALAQNADGTGTLEPLASFVTNPAGAAIINSIGPLRHVVTADQKESRRYLVIATGTAKEIGQPVQIQLER